MKPLRVYRPVFADLHHFDGEQNKVKSRIRIRMMRIRSLALQADRFQKENIIPVPCVLEIQEMMKNFCAVPYLFNGIVY